VLQQEGSLNETDGGQSLFMRQEIRYQFEGEMLTMPEIERLVPALSRKAIRNHLAAGRDTRRSMLSRDSAALRSASGRRNGAILKKLIDSKLSSAVDRTG
jgi:hypothetical protein